MYKSLVFLYYCAICIIMHITRFFPAEKMYFDIIWKSSNIKGPIFFHNSSIFIDVFLFQNCSHVIQALACSGSGASSPSSSWRCSPSSLTTTRPPICETCDQLTRLGGSFQCQSKQVSGTILRPSGLILGHLGPLGLQLLGRHMDLLGRWASTKENLNVIQLLYLYNASCKQKPCLIHSVSYK